MYVVHSTLHAYIHTYIHTSYTHLVLTPFVRDQGVPGVGGKDEGARDEERFNLWHPRCGQLLTPNPPTNIVPTNIAWVKLSGKFPMDMRIPPLYIKIVLESNPPKSTILVGRLAVAWLSRPFRPFSVFCFAVLPFCRFGITVAISFPAFRFAL